MSNAIFIRVFAASSEEIVWRRHVRWSRTRHLAAVSELDGQFSRRDDCGATIQAARRYEEEINNFS